MAELGTGLIVETASTRFILKPTSSTRSPFHGSPLIDVHVDVEQLNADTEAELPGGIYGVTFPVDLDQPLQLWPSDQALDDPVTTSMIRMLKRC